MSPAWLRWRPEFERGAAAVTARLLELAGVAPGQSVLDVGSGVGEPALSAARAVGPTGCVVGIDISPAMVAAAREAAGGLGNVDFVVHDIETAALPKGRFDVALGRWSLMFAADRPELLRVVADLLKPGGILAAAVWGAPDRVPVISLAFRVISRRLALDPPPPGPGPFSMADPQALEGELRGAGFLRVEIHPLIIPFTFSSVAEFTSFSRDVLPPGMRQLLERRCGSVHDRETWEAFAVAAADYLMADGSVSVPSECLCVRAITRGPG